MVNDLRGTFRGFDAPVRRRPVAPLLQRSAALALCCASTLLFNRSPAPLHRRPAAPARWRSKFSGAPLLRHSGAPLHQHSTAPASRYSGVLLLKRSVAPALCHSTAPALRCSGAPLLCEQPGRWSKGVEGEISSPEPCGATPQQHASHTRRHAQHRTSRLPAGSLLTGSGRDARAVRQPAVLSQP